VAAVLATLPATAMCQNVNISVVGVLSGSPSEVNQIIWKRVLTPDKCREPVNLTVFRPVKIDPVRENVPLLRKCHSVNDSVMLCFVQGFEGDRDDTSTSGDRKLGVKNKFLKKSRWVSNQQTLSRLVPEIRKLPVTDFTWDAVAKLRKNRIRVIAGQTPGFFAGDPRALVTTFFGHLQFKFVPIFSDANFLDYYTLLSK
jgi:hypothetical protein